MISFFSALGEVLVAGTLILMLTGVAIGFIVGILPGLGGAVTLALMLPFTFNMAPVEAFAFLLGMAVVTGTTGDITATLFGIPGEPTSAASVLDGYPMTRKGQGGRALGAVLFSSTLGAWIGAFALALAVPVIRPLVLALGPPEFFVLTVVGLTFIATLSGRSVVKGLIMACLGLFIASVGIDPQSGVPRFTLGQLYLWDGVDIIPLVVGLFGGAEVLQIMLSRASIASEKAKADGENFSSGVREGMMDVLRHWWLLIRTSLIGVGIGVVPGMGGSVAQWIAYGHAQQTSKHPEEFGKGSIEGVVAAGAVNNAKESGSLIPVIGFGIPGSVTTAVLLTAFIITGLNPGPEMLTTNVNVTFSMVWIIVLSNLVAVIAAFILLKPLTRLTFISGPILVPFLLLVLTLGSFTANNSFNDILVMFAASALGVVCIRWDWPRVPFLLGVVLGGIAERYLFLSYSLFGWTWIDRPIVLLLWGVLFLVVVVPALKALRERLRKRGERRDAEESARKRGERRDAEESV
jgi:putative tricarboxylic transport membrane protein